MASFLDFILMSPPLGWKVRSSPFQRGRKSNGDERRKTKGSFEKRKIGSSKKILSLH